MILALPCTYCTCGRLNEWNSGFVERYHFVGMEGRDGEEGHRVDDECSWLSWEDKSMGGIQIEWKMTIYCFSTGLYSRAWVSKGLALGGRSASRKKNGALLRDRL